MLGRGGKVVPAAVKAAIDIAMSVPLQRADAAEPMRTDPLADGVEAFDKTEGGVVVAGVLHFSRG